MVHWFYGLLVWLQTLSPTLTLTLAYIGNFHFVSSAQDLNRGLATVRTCRPSPPSPLLTQVPCVVFCRLQWVRCSIDFYGLLIGNVTRILISNTQKLSAVLDLMCHLFFCRKDWPLWHFAILMFLPFLKSHLRPHHHHCDRHRGI